MKKIDRTLFSFGSALTIAAASMLATSAANAVTMSGEEFKEYAPEEAYWVVSVNCDDGSDSRIVQRKTDGNQWCGKEVEGFCFDTKTEAAQQVCGAEYSATLNQAKQASQEQQRLAEEKRQAERERREAEARAEASRQQAAEAKRQNQIKIDEQLLQIEQEKLSLRRQELELQRRAVEIREALEKLGS